MAESPRHLIAVAFHVTLMGRVGAQHFGDVTRHAWLFGYTDYHISYSVVQLSVVQLDALRVIDYVESSICEERSNPDNEFIEIMR
jgi:hypothetical protein